MQLLGHHAGKHSLRLLAASVVILLTLDADASNLTVTGLKCEFRFNPLGIETSQPRLSWLLESAQRGQTQTAYEILASSTPERLSSGRADLWDSGKVSSSQSIHVVYQGKPLRSGQRIYWRVRAWDKDGQPSDFSQPAWWEMGLMKPEAWRATWISADKRGQPSGAFDDNPAPLFRKEFTIEKPVRRARAYVTGLGYYELHLNGERVGDQVLDPGWTSYAKRVLYSTYDVTAQLQRGTNTLGVMLGNGWFNPLPLRMWGWLELRDHLTVGEPRLLLQLEVEFADGTSKTVATDESWKVSDGPLLRNSVYLGEVYDARREQPGWDRAGFDDSAWKPAVRASDALGPLSAQDAPPIRITRTLKPVKITQPKPGVFIYDFGQNFAGWLRLRVRGPAGARVQMRYGELLYPDGTLNGMTSVCGQIKGGGAGYRYEGVGEPKTAWQQDEYILRGGGEEVYTPQFTFHGFRFVELTGGIPESEARNLKSETKSQASSSPVILELEGLRLNSDVAAAGAFECSNQRLNRIQQMVLWTELSNLFSVESDCPHREKFGYGGDIVAASEMGILNFDMSRFFAKAVQDLADAARTNGGLTETSPFVGISSEGLGGEAGPIGWGTAYPLLQWQLYQYYGDRRLLEEHYETTKRWVAFLQSRAQDGILDNGISDHESLAPKPRALTGTAFYYFNLVLLARISHVLGRQADAAEAETLAGQIKSAFNQKFLQPGTGRYDTGTQACEAFSLYLGLTPAEEKNAASDLLVKDIVAKHEGHLTPGIFGTKFMLNALTELNHADVAYQIVNQRTFPGWGYMLENGATTLWEHWEFSDNTYSHNHPMFGSVSEWFYKGLAGINPAPEAVGFDQIIIKPQPVNGLDWARASYDSVHGKMISEWQRTGDRFHLHVRVPVGAAATVFLPAHTLEQVTEGGKPLARAPGVQILRSEAGRRVIAIGSGDYQFESRL
jgi:alpha-L-rhamnosidase